MDLWYPGTKGSRWTAYNHIAANLFFLFMPKMFVLKFSQKIQGVPIPNPNANFNSNPNPNLSSNNVFKSM